MDGSKARGRQIEGFHPAALCATTRTMGENTPASLAGCIDHTLLDRRAGPEALDALCDQALAYGFKGVCVYPDHVARVAGRLARSDVVVVSVVGFPTGLDTTGCKVDEALGAVGAGAREIDMVVHPVALQTLDYRAVWADIAAVVAAVAPWPVKVILETAALDHDQIVAGCVLSKAAGAAFVKTSTGFGPGGATVEDVALLRRIVGSDMGVKASGGIKNATQALNMIRAGADRLGTSASTAIVEEKE